MPRSGRKLMGKRDVPSAPDLGNTACTFQLPAPSAHALQACYPSAIDLLEVSVERRAKVRDTDSSAVVETTNER